MRLWTVCITDDKRDKILSQLRSLRKSSTTDVKTLESLTDRMLWLSSLCGRFYVPFGALSTEHYLDIPITMISGSANQWSDILLSISSDLVLQKRLAHSPLPMGTKIVRAANIYVHDAHHASTVHFKSRRIWLEVQIANSSKRKIEDDFHAALSAWSDVLTGTSMLYNMHPPCHIDTLAFADACASQHQAGFGGILRLQGKVVAWFAFNITLEQASQCFLGFKSLCNLILVPWNAGILLKSCVTWSSVSNFSIFFMS